jgi:hypothetical protein
MLKLTVAIFAETLENLQNSMAHVPKAKVSHLQWLLVLSVTLFHPASNAEVKSARSYAPTSLSSS